MNQGEFNELLRRKQELRRARDADMKALLKTHFEKLSFIQSSGVSLAAQTSYIVGSIRRAGLGMCAAGVERLGETVGDTGRIYGDEDEEEEGGNHGSSHGGDLDSMDDGESGVFKRGGKSGAAGGQSDSASHHQGSKQSTKERHMAAEDNTFVSDEIKQLVSAMDNQLEEYCKVLQLPSNNSVKFKECLKECNHAADQLAQQVKIIEDRSLENSKQYFDSLSDDEHKGGNARLVRSIAINVQSVEDSTRKLQADITESRKEFLKMSQLNGLLEVAPHHCYEKVRDTYAHIRRMSQKKSDESNKQWLQFEKQCRDKQLAEMRRIYDMYVGSTDPAIIQSASKKGISTFESKLQEHRVRVNQKLKEFNDTVIDISDRNIDKITSDADVLLTWRNKIIPWELQEQRDMEASLASCVRNVEDKYSFVVEDLRAHHAHVLGQIDALELHRQKLSHLLKIPPNKQRLMRERSGKFGAKPVALSKSRVLGSSAAVATPSLVMEDIPVPDSSLRLGSRTVHLGRLVCVDDDECLQLLSQLLHDVHPDSIVMKRMQHYVAHYTKLSIMRKNAPPKS